MVIMSFGMCIGCISKVIRYPLRDKRNHILLAEIVLVKLGGYGFQFGSVALSVHNHRILEKEKGVVEVTAYTFD
jgi:hypothetical protein